MRAVAERYCDSIHKNFVFSYANWRIDRRINIGDFGYLRNGALFEVTGNLRNDFEIEVSSLKSPSPSHIRFATKGSSVTSFKSGFIDTLSAVNANAHMKLAFAGEDDLFFNAAGCVGKSVPQKRELGNEIKKLGKEWDSRWAVITDLVSAKSTTVAIASEANAEATIEAKGEIAEIDLGNAEIDLSVTNSNRISFVCAGEAGHTPLFGLCKFQRRFVPPEMIFRTMSFPNFEDNNSEQLDPIQETEFYQLR